MLRVLLVLLLVLLMLVRTGKDQAHTQPPAFRCVHPILFYSLFCIMVISITRPRPRPSHCDRLRSMGKACQAAIPFFMTLSS